MRELQREYSGEPTWWRAVVQLMFLGIAVGLLMLLVGLGVLVFGNPAIGGIVAGTGFLTALGIFLYMVSGQTGKAAGGAFGFFLLIGLGLAGSGTIILVTALRRRGHRKRLIAGAGSPRYVPIR